MFFACARGARRGLRAGAKCPLIFRRRKRFVWAQEKATYLFLEEAVEDEDKHSLESVEYGEEVCHDDRGLVDEEEAEGPREAQQTQQGEGPHHPGSEGCQSNTHTHTHG